MSEQNTSAYPPLTEQASNLAGAVGRAAQAVVTGNAVIAPKEEYSRRFRICVACEHFHGMHVRCRKCGCKLKAKLRLATERCPAGKWDFHESEIQTEGIN